jgi:lipopolysaccharide cholinephosphotransferase
MQAKLYGNEYFSFHGCTSSDWEKYIKLADEMTTNEIIGKYIEACSECDYESAERTGIHCLRTEYECCYWYKEDFDELILLDFMNIKVPAPKGYERCLRIKWNNYMEFPPETERGYKHAGEIHNPYVAYDNYDASMFLSIFDDIENKKILLFGSGEIFDNYMEQYGLMFKPEYVFDNNESKWGTVVNGIEVQNPELIKEYDMTNTRLIITSRYHDEIEKQVESMGVAECYKYIYGRRYKELPEAKKKLQYLNQGEGI